MPNQIKDTTTLHTTITPLMMACCVDQGCAMVRRIVANLPGNGMRGGFTIAMLADFRNQMIREDYDIFYIDTATVMIRNLRSLVNYEILRAAEVSA